jgi:hypothetical protein
MRSIESLGTPLTLIGAHSGNRKLEAVNANAPSSGHPQSGTEMTARRPPMELSPSVTLPP